MKIIHKSDIVVYLYHFSGIAYIHSAVTKEFSGRQTVFFRIIQPNETNLTSYVPKKRTFDLKCFFFHIVHAFNSDNSSFSLCKDRTRVLLLVFSRRSCVLFQRNGPEACRGFVHFMASNVDVFRTIDQAYIGDKVSWHLL